MVYPSEDEVSADTGLVFKFLAALGSGALFKKLIYGFNAYCNKLFGINRADSLDVNDFVSHSKLLIIKG